MKKALVPLLIIATGIGWMLTTNDIMPGVNWAFVLVMAVLGILTLLNKLTKLSIVLGPILLIGSVVMVMLQTEKLKIEMGLPVLVIAFGLLMLIARFSSLPDGLKGDEPETPEGNDKDSTES